MKIAFVTTQSLEGSTVVGRILPIADELIMKDHDVHILVHKEHGNPLPRPKKLNVYITGKDPFTKTETGKKRLSGIGLIFRMKTNALKATIALLKIKPDVVVIVKPLPENTTAVLLWKTFNPSIPIILDVDDFELTANALTSQIQRIAIHWSERTATRISKKIISATPFLADHFRQLTNEEKNITLIPTTSNVKTREVQNTTSNLLYIGSISVASGHRIDMLPDILKRVREVIPNTTLTIAGSGDDTAHIKKKFKKAGQAQYVTWTGRFNQFDIPKILENTSLIIDPIDASIANRAKSSFRVSTAIANGIPVITSNIGIRPMLIPEQLHKRLFALPEDTKSYAKHCINLLQNPLNQDEKNKMKEHSKKFSISSLAEKYNNIITS